MLKNKVLEQIHKSVRIPPDCVEKCTRVCFFIVLWLIACLKSLWKAYESKARGWIWQRSDAWLLLYLYLYPIPIVPTVFGSCLVVSYYAFSSLSLLSLSHSIWLEIIAFSSKPVPTGDQLNDSILPIHSLQRCFHFKVVQRLRSQVAWPTPALQFPS